MPVTGAAMEPAVRIKYVYDSPAERLDRRGGVSNSVRVVYKSSSYTEWKHILSCLSAMSTTHLTDTCEPHPMLTLSPLHTFPTMFRDAAITETSGAFSSHWWAFLCWCHPPTSPPLHRRSVPSFMSSFVFISHYLYREPMTIFSLNNSSFTAY